MKNFPLFALNDDDHTHTNDTESGTKSKEHTLSFYCLNDGLKQFEFEVMSPQSQSRERGVLHWHWRICRCSLPCSRHLQIWKSSVVPVSRSGESEPGRGRLPAFRILKHQGEIITKSELHGARDTLILLQHIDIEWWFANVWLAWLKCINNWKGRSSLW